MVLQLLRRKAKELQSLNKVPYLPKAVDYFEETSSVYWVEEWVKGHSLAERLQLGKPLSHAQVAKVLKDVLQALDCLHGYGAKHRSLKPDNLIWQQPNNQLVLCGLCEFKKIVARVARSQGQPLHRSTEDEAIYIPPEQTPTQAHFNSDLYALGIMGIQAISGLGVKDLHILQEMDQSRSLKVPWRGGEIQTSSALLGILVKMVHFDSKQRYQLAQDVLADLARWEKQADRAQASAEAASDEASAGKSKQAGTEESLLDLPATKASLVKESTPNKTVPSEKAAPLGEETPLRKEVPSGKESFLKKAVPMEFFNWSAQPAPIVAAEAETLTAATAQTNAPLDPAGTDEAVLEDGASPTSREQTAKVAPFRLGRLGAIAATLAVAVAVAMYAKLPQRLTGQYWLQQAKGDYQRGDDTAAIAAYSRALALNPNNGQAYYQRGLAYERLGEIQLALQDLTRAIKQGTEVAQARYYRGNLRFELGDRQGAIADYTQAIAAQPDFAKAYVNRASAQADLGNDSQAIVDYSQAIALDDTLAAAFLNRCLSYSNTNNQAAALADCNRAIELRPLNALAYQNRGLVRRRQGEIQAALTDYNTAIRLNPDDADPYYNRGIARWELGDNAGAVADFSHAIARNPDHVLAYYDRGLAHARLRDREQAIADFQQSAKLCLDLGRVDCYNDAQFQLGQLQ